MPHGVWHASRRHAHNDLTVRYPLTHIVALLRLCPSERVVTPQHDLHSLADRVVEQIKRVHGGREDRNNPPIGVASQCPRIASDSLIADRIGKPGTDRSANQWDGAGAAGADESAS